MELLTVEKLLTYVDKDKEFGDYSKSVQIDYEMAVKELIDDIRNKEGVFVKIMNRTIGACLMFIKGGFDIMLMADDDSWHKDYKYLHLMNEELYIIFKITINLNK